MAEKLTNHSDIEGMKIAHLKKSFGHFFNLSTPRELRGTSQSKNQPP